MSDKHDHTIEQKYEGTVDSEILNNYATFLNAAKEMLGRKEDLKVTTGGGRKSIGHLHWQKFIDDAMKYYGVTKKEVAKGSKKSKAGNIINQALINRAAKMMSKKANLEYTRGALDIGIGGNKLTNEEALKLGKLALKHGLRVIEEDDHLHLDSRQNTTPNAPRTHHVDRSRRRNVTKKMSRESIAREKALKQFLKDEEQANIDFNLDANIATEKEQYEQKQKQEEWNRPASPMSTLRQSMQPKEEEAKRESLNKMSIAKDIDFGIYS